MRRTPFIAILMACLAVGATAEVLAQTPDSQIPTRYYVQSLGTLGGFSGSAFDVNNLGQVVGSADIPDGSRHAFLWTDGEMIDLGTISFTTQSEAHGINDLGQVVGGSSGGSVPIFAFIWLPEPAYGLPAGLNDLGVSGGWAYSINNSGQVVGIMGVVGGGSHAFLWENGVATDLGTLGGSRSLARDINEVGQVVGKSFTGSGERAFLWDDGIMINLGNLGLGGSEALGINGLGQVVGRSQYSPDDKSSRAFLWGNGVMTDISTAMGLASGTGYDINDQGLLLANTRWVYEVSTGEFRFLQDLLPVDSPISNSSGIAISNTGYITGRGWDSTDEYGLVPILLTPAPPIPTVSHWGLAVTALLLLSAGTIAQRRLVPSPSTLERSRRLPISSGLVPPAAPGVTALGCQVL